MSLLLITTEQRTTVASVNASASGATLADATSLLPGTATGAAGAAGVGVTTTDTVLAGTATGASSAAGVLLADAVTLLAGAAGVAAAAAGGVLASAATLVHGTAAGAAGAGQGGAILPSAPVLLPGTAAGGDAQTGQVLLPATAELLDGQRTADASVMGVMLFGASPQIVQSDPASLDALAPGDVLEVDMQLLAGQAAGDQAQATDAGGAGSGGLFSWERPEAAHAQGVQLATQALLLTAQAIAAAMARGAEIESTGVLMPGAAAGEIYPQARAEDEQLAETMAEWL